jgi:hypothetical protein
MPRGEQLAEPHDPLLALVGRHEVRQLRPAGDERESQLGVGHDGRRGAQRDGDAGAGGEDRAQRRGARLCLERFAVVAVVGVQVQGSGAGVYRRARLGGEFFGRTRRRGMVAIAVERRLQQAVAVRQGGLFLPWRLGADGTAVNLTQL